MATKMSLHECLGTKAEDRKNSLLIGCTSLRFANLFDQTRPGINHVMEIRGNAAPLLVGTMGKSARQQQQKKTLSDAYGKRYDKPRNGPATACLMTGWVYFMLLLLTPFYLLMVWYLTPQTVQSCTQLVPIGEFTGNGIFIVSNNGTLQWLLVEEVVLPAPMGYYRTLPHYYKMDCPCAASTVKFNLSKMVAKRNSTDALLPKHQERKRRALPEEGRERVGRDLLQMLRGSYEKAKTSYMNVQREMMSQASEVKGLYNKQVSPRLARSVPQGKLVPGSYLMFRMTRSLADDLYDTGKNRTRIDAVSFKLAGKKKPHGPDVIGEKTNKLGTGKKEPSKRDVEDDVQDEKMERGTEKRGEKFNDVDSEIAFEEIVSDDKMDATVANGAEEEITPQTNSGGKVDLRDNPTANEVSEENTDATIYKLDRTLKATMVPTVPMEGNKKCNGSKKNTEGKEKVDESVLGENMEPATPEKGLVEVEEKDEKEKKSELLEKAMSENLTVYEDKAGEGKALSEEPGGMGEEDKSPEPGEKVMQTPHSEGGSEAAESGDTDPAAGTFDIDAKDEQKN